MHIGFGVFSRGVKSITYLDAFLSRTSRHDCRCPNIYHVLLIVKFGVSMASPSPISDLLVASRSVFPLPIT